MFKPLLRTMPSLSGNMKVVCFLSNYTDIGNNTFESNVRSARLNCISSQLYNKYFNLSLLSSSYEWDVKNFYKKYSEYFYKSMFSYNKEDLPEYSEHGDNKNRDTDFEFGMKRVSYLKSGKQFGFFAPIWIESENDMPDYFEISLDIENTAFKAKRKIRVNIANKISEGENYIGSYIYDYAKKIDGNVVYCNAGKFEGVYYGIDVESGGFSTKHDSRFQALLTKQNSILNFDNLIAKGFERNKLIVKQIIPLSFYFSLNDILSDVEKSMFYGANVKASGKWVKDGIESPFYDFEHDYTMLQPTIKKLSNENGGIGWRMPFAEAPDGTMKQMNIMNMGYPSMKEASFYKYRFANKVSPSFCRWKLKQSPDDHPYITNMSPAFSLYQGSKVKYGQFPTMHETLAAIVIKKPFYLNLFLPLNGGEEKYPLSTCNKYAKARENFSCEWFETFYSIEDMFTKCVNVDSSKAYFNGVLYDLNDIYDRLPASSLASGAIEKFGVFIRPIFHFINDEQIREENVYSNYTIFKENSKYLHNKDANCHVNDNMLSSTNPRIFSNLSTNVKKDCLSMNNIFVKNQNGDGDFILLSKYGIDWWESNSFIKAEDLEGKLEDGLLSPIKSISTDGFEILPVHRLSNMMDSSNKIMKEYSYYTTAYIGHKLSLKAPLENDVHVYGADFTSRHSLNTTQFYRAGKFIDKEKAIESIRSSYKSIVSTMHPGLTYAESEALASEYSNAIIENSIKPLTTYAFNPILEQNGEVYASNCFTSSFGFSPRFYGDSIKYYDSNCKTYTYTLDNDFIYVDPYNLNNIISHYNTTWLKDSEPLSYYHYPTEYLGDFADENVVEIAPFEWTWNNESHREVIAKLIDEHLQFVPTNAFSDDGRFFITFKENIRFKCAYTFFYASINNETNKLYSGATKEEAEYIYEYGKTHDPSTGEEYEMPIEYGGKQYSVHAISVACNYLNDIDLMSGDEAIEKHRKRNKQFVFAEMGLHIANFGSAKNYIMMDNLTTKCTYVKFLNKLHLKHYFKCICAANPSESNFNATYSWACNALSSIYIRKRVSRADLTIMDAHIKLTDIFALPIYGNEEASIEELMRTIEYDESTSLFYFNQLCFKNGKFYKMNTSTDEEVRSQLLWWDIEQLYDTYYAADGSIEKELNPTKLKFELVFKKEMIKVDDNLWRLINLEEKYAAPYKDLYLYEIEHEYEYNKALQIQLYDAKLGYGNETTYAPTTIVADIENELEDYVHGCLKPMFNLVKIETKDESKIYTEYSVNNITKSTLIDPMKLSNNNILHFYRHNCNNEVAMYDLSTMNKSIPIEINGKKYVYKEAFPELPEGSSYIYFEDTYDLFGDNKVEFANYCSSFSYNIIIGTKVVQEEIPIEIKGSYNLNAFIAAMPTEYNAYFKSRINEHGTFFYDSGTSCTTMTHLPTKSIEFRTTTYAYVPSERIEDVYGDAWSYIYYDDLKLFESFGLSTYNWISKDSGESTTYGFYLIDVHLNNTTSTFNAISYDGDNLKYISYVNSMKISGNEENMAYLYKQLMPFIKSNPLRYFIENSYCMMKPSVFNIPLDYHPVPVRENGKLAYYDVAFAKGEFGSISCERYLDSIVPLITEKSMLSSYSIKHKDVKKSFFPTYFTNEVIYPVNESINYYPGVRIYDMNNNSEYRVVDGYEWKHFNANKGINLEEKFSYEYEDLLTKAEVKIAQSSLKVYNVFKEHLLSHAMSKLDEDGIKWAYEKYKKAFECEAVKIDSSEEEKLYSLTIIFELF